MEVKEETVNQLKITLTEDCNDAERRFLSEKQEGQFSVSRIIFVFTLCKGKTW